MGVVTVELEVGDTVGDMDARWVTLKVGGVGICSELVYDTDKEGNRTVEQAEENFFLVLRERLRRVWEL